MRFGEIRPFVRYAGEIDGAYRAGEAAVHARDNRLLYMLSGDMALALDGREYALSADACAIWPSSAGYVVRVRPSTRFLVVNFDYEYAPERPETPLPMVEEVRYREELAFERVCFADAPELEGPLVLEDGKPLRDTLLELAREYADGLPHAGTLSGALLARALVYALRLVSGAPREEELTRRVLDYLRENAVKPLTNADLGRAFGYHPNALNRIFLARTGRTLHKQLLDYRLQRALTLLRGTDLTVREIARETGFQSENHFSASVRKYTGRSPGALRGRGV